MADVSINKWHASTPEGFSSPAICAEQYLAEPQLLYYAVGVATMLASVIVKSLRHEHINTLDLASLEIPLTELAFVFTNKYDYDDTLPYIETVDTITEIAAHQQAEGNLQHLANCTQRWVHAMVIAHQTMEHPENYAHWTMRERFSHVNALTTHGRDSPASC